MQFSIFPIAAILAISASVFGAPFEVVRGRAVCTAPALRKAWHLATTAERTAYTNAVLCLATKPSKIGLNTTLYDDFTWVHARQEAKAHGVAAFLPWHRYFIQIYEDELKKTCGYTGSLLYWDWERSSDLYPDLRDDPIWSPTLGQGVGGNGLITTDELARCVQNGPFKNLRPAWYKGQYAPKCLTRQFTPPSEIATNGRWMDAQWYSSAFMEYPKSASTYSSFRLALEGRGHAQVHGGVGGDLAPTDSSPNEPLFFLHHTNVDRYWWTWQQANTTARTYDYGGWDGSGVAQGNLSRILDMSGLAPSRTVRDYMDSVGQYSCFKY